MKQSPSTSPLSNGSESSLRQSLALIHANGSGHGFSRRHSDHVQEAANFNVSFHPSTVSDKKKHFSRIVDSPVPTLPFMSDAAPAQLMENPAMIPPTHCNTSQSCKQGPRLPCSNVNVAQVLAPMPPHGHLGFRKDYILGDPAKSSRHMVVESSRQDVSKKLVSLKPYDFAFIRRRDGTWTYAILACRSLEYMMFVLNDQGTTKTIQKRHWKSFIRCVVADDEGCSMSNTQRMIPKEISVLKDCDECSMISFDML